MCFSAKASFITSGILAGTSLLTFSHIQKREQIPFALIPVFFAIQQFCEGLIWLIHNETLNSEILLKISTYIFIFYALVIWPIWIPFSVLILEKKKIVKNLLLIFLVFGLFYSLNWLNILLKSQIIPKIECSHIYYTITQTFMPYGWSLKLYILLTVLPFFVSSRKSLNIFGFLVALSVLFSYLYWEKYFISVWCFFAALLSILIYLIIRWQNFRNSFDEILSNYRD